MSDFWVCDFFDCWCILCAARDPWFTVAVQGERVTWLCLGRQSLDFWLVRPPNIPKDAYQSPLSKYDTSRKANIESWGTNGRFRKQLPPKRDPRPKEGVLAPQGPPFISENTLLPEDVHKGITYQHQWFHAVVMVWWTTRGSALQKTEGTELRFCQHKMGG
jgi:hypothetical protein